MAPNNSFKPTRIVVSATCLRYASTRPAPLGLTQALERARAKLGSVAHSATVARH
jgi:hypothetical protein